MSVINLRVGNDALTFQELDDNFTNLNNDKYESGDDIVANTISVSSTNLVTNLNADLLDGQQGSYYLDYTNATNKPTIGNGTITITAGTDLSTGGSFTVNQTGATTVTLNHSTISSGTSSNTDTLTHEGTFAAVTGVTISTQGHVTDVETTTFTMPAGAVPNNTTITLTAGTGLSGGGDFTVDQSVAEEITFNLDFSELTDMTADISGTTEFILQNGTVESRKAASEIKLSAFNNNLTSVPGDFTIAGNLTVNGNSVTISSETLSIIDPLIHLASNNEVSDTLDIGFIGHYSDDGGTTKRHTGFFRDATDNKYYLFNNYVDSGLDDGTATSINRGDASFNLATLSIANLEITSTATVTNLNADRLDSQHGSYYLDYNNQTNRPSRWASTFMLMGA